MIVFSIAAFGLVGIVGGDICGRVKYFFAPLRRVGDDRRLEPRLQPAQGVELVENARERFTRYGEPFSVVVIEPGASALRGTASHPPARAGARSRELPCAATCAWSTRSPDSTTAASW